MPLLSQMANGIRLCPSNAPADQRVLRLSRRAAVSSSLSGFAAIVNAELKHYSTPAAALYPNVKARGSLEPHFIRINPSNEELAGSKDHRSRRAERVNANLLRAPFREEVSSTIEIELVPDLVLAVAPL